MDGSLRGGARVWLMLVSVIAVTEGGFGSAWARACVVGVRGCVMGKVTESMVKAVVTVLACLYICTKLVRS